MSQYPVEFTLKDSEGVIEAINYALSGPSGLGQNFSGFNDSFPAWIRGNIRTPQTVAGYTTPAHGASGEYSITVSNPGSVRQNDPNVPSKIQVGQYVYGTNIGVGAQVDISYEPATTPWIVPLTVANTGAVQGAATFYTLPIPILYVAPIAINTIEWIDIRTLQVNFVTATATPPFDLGSLPTISGSTFYNGTYANPGVVECTTSYVTIQLGQDTVNQGLSTGGTIKLSSTIQPPTVGVDPGFPFSVNFNATDASNTAIVNGNLDRVFISAQLDNTITYTASAASVIEYSVAINRYIGIVPTQAQQATTQFFFDSTIAVQTYQYSVAIGSATLPQEKTVFTNVIDNPQSNYYLYRIDLLFRVINDSGAAEVTASKLGNRSIAIQVVKQ
jgi:hypothetical protein